MVGTGKDKGCPEGFPDELTLELRLEASKRQVAGSP